MNCKQFLSCTLAAVIASQNCQAIFAGEKGGVDRTLALYSSVLLKNNGFSVSNKSDNANDELGCYDKYVKVVDNRYVLEIPDDVFASDDIKAKIQEQIDRSNKLISMENLTINPYTKSAIIMSDCVCGEGITSIEFYWNYVHVNIAAPILRIILQAGVGGAEAAIMAALNVTSTVALGIAGAIWGALSGIIGEYVNDGIWFDLNYSYNVIDFGRQ